MEWRGEGSLPCSQAEDMNSWTVTEGTSRLEARAEVSRSTPVGHGLFRSPPAFCVGVALGDAQQRARVGTCTKGGPEGCLHSKSLN